MPHYNDDFVYNIYVDTGDYVVCDICSADYTESQQSGGFIFNSYAICPSCADNTEQSAIKHKEQHCITHRCPNDTSFADFIRSLRSPSGV